MTQGETIENIEGARVLMSSFVGVEHFLEMMSDYHPQWTVIAIKASIDRVINCLTKMKKIDRLIRDIPICDREDVTDNSPDNLTVVVQPKDNFWTVIFWSSSAMAQLLSQHLITKAATIETNDTDASTMYEIYEDGTIIERAYRSPDLKILYESERYPEPNLDLLEPEEDELTCNEITGKTHNEISFNEFVDRIFCEEGIYIPTCWSW